MISRLFTHKVQELLDFFPVVAVVGSRQVGKSTLVQMPEIGSNRRYFTLDDLAVRQLAERDPESLLEVSGALTIDEVQLVPELLRAIKKSVDQDRRPGRFLLTGSADLNVLADLSGVLAGRVGIVQLPPLTLFEERGETGRPCWLQVLQGDNSSRPTPVSPFDWSRIVVGGFPLSVTAANDRQRTLWFENFRKTYLERDVRRMRDIGHLTDFARLMELVAARTAQLLNQAALAREIGLNAATAGRYLSLLEASFLSMRLHPWHANLGKRLVKTPKRYWTDTGIACHLCGLHHGDLPGHPMTGPLFETFAVTEVEALLSHFLPEVRLHFFRSQTGLEVDLLIQKGQTLFPVEIKASRSVTPDDAASILRWREWTGMTSPGLVLYPGTEIKPLGRNITAMPITA